MLEAATLDFPAHEAVAPCAARRIVSIMAHRGQDGTLAQALGVVLPVAPRAVTMGGVRYLWAGPGAWLVMSDDPDRLDGLFALSHIAAVSEQGDGHCLFRVQGPRMRAILANLVPIDLSETAFFEDSVALTLAGHIGVKIWRETDGFILACFRSFALSLHHALMTAAGGASGRG